MSGDPGRSSKGADKAAGGKAGKGRRASVGSDHSLPLTAEALSNMKLHKTEAAEIIEARVSKEHESLELRVGRMLVGQKKSLPEIIREWDGNGNGEIEKIELRQVVRNKMKIKADNKAIDSLFDQLDQDGSGELDAKEMAAALKAFKERCQAREEEQDALRAEAVELHELVVAIDEAMLLTLEVEALQRKIRELTEGVSDGPVEIKIAVALYAQEKRTNESHVKQEVLALLDPDKAGVTAKETFVEWAGSILNDSEQMSAIADYYEELEGITGTQPLATKKGLRHIFEKVGECLAEETEAVEVEIKKRKEAKRLQKQIIATNDVYDAKVAERNEIEARREQEKLEAAKIAKAERKAAKTQKLEAKAKAEQSFNRRVEKRRSSVELSSMQVNMLSMVNQKAEEERAERERKLRASFAIFDIDGDGFLSVDELKAVLMRPNTGSTLSEADVEELVREFDVNGDGVLEFDEFAPLWTDMFGDDLSA